MLSINEIPFFMSKKIRVSNNLYSNDKYPTCFQVLCDDTYYKVRLSSRFNPYSILREYNAIKYLEKAGIMGQPQVIDVGITQNYEDSYLVESFVPGKTLDKYKDDEIEEYFLAIANSLYSYLIKIHNIKDRNFHSFIGDSYCSYQEMLMTHIKGHIKTIASYDLKMAEQLSCIFKLFHQQKDKFKEIMPTFAHFDIKPQNIIFDRDTLQLVLIDYEYSRFADPYHELIRAHMKAKKSPVFYQKLWAEVEYRYRQSIKEPPPIMTVIYQLYYYISDLPYQYRIRDTNEINCISYLIQALEQGLS